MPQTICSRCAQLSALMCQRCQEDYCSIECQILDWKDHKSKCIQMPDLVPVKNSKSMLHKVPMSPGGRREHDFHDKEVVELSANKNGSGNDSVVSACGSVSSRLSASKRHPSSATVLLDDSEFEFKPRLAVMAWTNAYVPPQNAFFDVLVQYVEETDPSVCWVIERQYGDQLHRLVMEINRSIERDQVCKMEEIYVGALVAAPFIDLLQRAEVLVLNQDTHFATVRLIDNGNKLRLPFSKLYAPIPIMRNLNAHAIRICVPQKCVPVKVGTMLSVRLKEPKSTKGFFDVELERTTSAPALPIDLLSQSPRVTLVKSLHEGRHAVMQLHTFNADNMSKLNALLNCSESKKFEITGIPEVGAFYAAFIDNHWHRAALVKQLEDIPRYLVYLLDKGSMQFCTQIKQIPEEFMKLPIATLAISCSSAAQQTVCLTESSLGCDKNVTLHLLATCSGFNSKMKLLPCALHVNGEKLCDVVASLFTGMLQDLHLNYWNENIEQQSRVFITHIVSHSVVYISSAVTIDYSRIIDAAVKHCALYRSEEELVPGDIVIGKVPKSDQFFRGEVLSRDEKTFAVRNLDMGVAYNLSWKVLWKSNDLIRAMPVYLRKVNLLYLTNIQNCVTDSKAVQLLNDLQQKAIKFVVKFSEDNAQIVELQRCDGERKSLNMELVPLLFIKSGTSVTVDKNLFDPPKLTEALPQVPQVQQQKHLMMPNLNVTSDGDASGNKSVFTLKDLEFVTMTIGKNVPLLVLDASRIDEGYITAADVSDTNMLRILEENLAIVSKYCQCPHVKKDYSPKVNEICLAIYEDDGEWYRALCTSYLKNGTFSVVFVDYGNASKVSKEHVMPMTKHLMFPTIANRCYIDGFAPAKSGKYAEILQANTIVMGNVAKSDNKGAYTISLCAIEQ